MRTAWRFPETIKTRPVFDATMQTRTGVFRHQSNQLRMGRFKIIHGVFEFAHKIPDQFRLLLAASGFVRRSFDQTGNISSYIRSRLTRIFLGPILFLKAVRCRESETGRNYAQDQKFQMAALFNPNPYDQYRDRLAVRGGFATNACASAKIELSASRRQRKFFHCPQPHERGEAWNNETTDGFAGRTL
jgi:hypothetical protein